MALSLPVVITAFSETNLSKAYRVREFASGQPLHLAIPHVHRGRNLPSPAVGSNIIDVLHRGKRVKAYVTNHRPFLSGARQGFAGRCSVGH